MESVMDGSLWPVSLAQKRGREALVPEAPFQPGSRKYHHLDGPQSPRRQASNLLVTWVQNQQPDWYLLPVCAPDITTSR